MIQLVDKGEDRAVINYIQEKPMRAPTSTGPADKSIKSNAAEEICKSLEETILKYFPQIEKDDDRPKPSSVPLVPQQYKKLQT